MAGCGPGTRARARAPRRARAPSPGLSGHALPFLSQPPPSDLNPSPPLGPSLCTREGTRRGSRADPASASARRPGAGARVQVQSPRRGRAVVAVAAAAAWDPAINSLFLAHPLLLVTPLMEQRRVLLVFVLGHHPSLLRAKHVLCSMYCFPDHSLFLGTGGGGVTAETGVARLCLPGSWRLLLRGHNLRRGECVNRTFAGGMEQGARCGCTVQESRWRCEELLEDKGVLWVPCPGTRLRTKQRPGRSASWRVRMNGPAP